MFHLQFLEIGLVLLAFSSAFSLERNLVLFPPRMTHESLQLPNNLQASSIQQCLPHRKNFLFPWKSMNLHQYQKGHILAIIHEMLQQIFNLFQAKAFLGLQKENYIQFLNELHQQLEYLQVIMRLDTEQQNGAWGGENLRLQVKAYFRRMRDYLENQAYSSCARIIVQVEVNRCLFFVHTLTRSLRSEN
ncbi:interferon epsilon [Perognathus longimembris pacificus]|uniref:interferon epsilon n=1 Tax=Perognathus longimembris pacificus TaxID=214514 RepID=UPI00201841E7|nr:interferon epsilon [Perognathus longimembris pacificus]